MEQSEVFEASVMLTYLRKEEDFYKKILQFMEQENVRLQVEEYAIRSAIRQQKIASQKLNIKQEMQSSEVPSTSSKKDNEKVDVVQRSEPDCCESSESTQNYQYSPSTPIQSRTSELDSVCSSITDDRYLEPLILNPSAYNDSGLVEFDD